MEVLTGENKMEVSKIKTELPYYLVIVLLGNYFPKMKTIIWKDISTLMFIAGLFTIAKIRKQPVSIINDR